MSSPSPPAVPLSRISSPPATEAPKESAVARLFIAPITFISFLISLALVDSRNSSLRTHYHSTSHSAPSATLYGRSKQTLRSWIYRPEPYSYVKSPNALEREKSGEKVDKTNAKDEPWHWNTKQRKMMKMEVSDAFEMRKTVVVILLSMVLGLGVLIAWGARVAYSTVLSRF